MISKGKSYGSEHDTIAAFDRIKFVRYNGGVVASPIETMTAVIIYVTVYNTSISLKSIAF